MRAEAREELCSLGVGEDKVVRIGAERGISSAETVGRRSSPPFSLGGGQNGRPTVAFDMRVPPVGTSLSRPNIFNGGHRDHRSRLQLAPAEFRVGSLGSNLNI
jgi:hypothetical protein